MGKATGGLVQQRICNIAYIRLPFLNYFSFKYCVLFVMFSFNSRYIAYTQTLCAILLIHHKNYEHTITK